MGNLHIMRFDIWEHCTIDEAEQRLTDQDKLKKVVKMTLIAQKAIMRTQKKLKVIHISCA